MNRKIIFVTRLLSLFIFILSLTQNALCFSHKCLDSLWAFSTGWILLVVGGANLSWLTNGLLISSLITIGKSKKTTLILVLSGIFFGMLPLLTRKIAIDEAGTLRPIITFELGYWLWLLSIIIILLGVILLFWNEKTKPNTV